MPLSELEKVAIFFVAIGRDRAEGILKRLGTVAVMQIAEAMKRVGPVSTEMKQAVLREMLDLLSQKEPRKPRRGRGPGRPAAPPSPGGSYEDLLKQVSDLFAKDIDVRDLDWGKAGYDFGPAPPPGDDSDDLRPGRGR